MKTVLIVLLGSVILVCGIGTAKAALLDNVQGYWHFDGDAGNSPDSSSNGYYLRPWESNMVVRTPLYGTGVVGQASDLDYHRASQFGEFWQNGPVVPKLRITGDITMMAWFYPREFNSSNRHLLGTYSTSGNNRSYLLNWTAGGAVGMTLDSDGLSGGSSNITISGVQLNTWNLAVGVLDGTTTRIYLAQLSDTSMGAPATGTHTGGIYASTAPFRIGLRADWPEPVNGLVDEMAVWDRALSSAEIGEIFALGKAGQEIPEPATLVLLMLSASGLFAARRRGKQVK